MSGFDVCGPLPTGVTVLEASAGTGKTYTIAALAARYVADGKSLEKLLLVTFTRMATGELRERVRERLVSAERVLSGAALPRDEVERLLLAADVERRRANLAKALADFDAATIATTHGFCQEVLGGLGVAGDAAREADLVEDVSDLVAEVVDDLYVRRFHREDGPPAFTRDSSTRPTTKKAPIARIPARWLPPAACEMVPKTSGPMIAALLPQRVKKPKISASMPRGISVDRNARLAAWTAPSPVPAATARA